MSEASFTSNGHEISHPREKMGAAEFKAIAGEYGLNGTTPAERAASLRNMPAENLAFFITDVNRRILGSEETLVSEKTVKLGEKPTVAPEYRYDLFHHLVNQIKEHEDVNPARVGDALGLGIVMLHPSKDGNGRTARMMALLFREEYDSEEYESIYNKLAESRDAVRERSGFTINGYIPYLEESADQSDPEAVKHYFDELLTSDRPGLYNGPAGQEPLLYQ